MTSSSKVSGFGRSSSLAPQVGVATILALVSFLSVYCFGVVAVTVVVLALAFLCVVVAKPELATLVVVFVLYSDAAAVVVHRYPALAPLAIGFFLLLFIPVINFVVFRREGLRINTALWLMVLYLVIMVTSALFSRIPAESFTTIVKYVFEGLVFYFLIINSVRSPQVLRKSVWILLFVASVLGTLSWIQNVTKSYDYDNEYGGFATTHLVLPNADNQKGDRVATGEESRGKPVTQFRALGPVADPNFYSEIMVAVLPFALVLAFSDRSKRARVIGAAACVPIMAGIVLSLSRGAAIAVFVVGISLFFMRYIKRRYAILLAAALVVLVVSNPAYFNRIGSISGISSHAAPDESVKERKGIIRTGLTVFLQHPLLGVGPGQASEYIELSGVGFSAGGNGLAPHNTYLQLLVDTGILGFGCFIAIVFVTIRNLLRASRYWIEKRPEYAHMSVALVLAIVAFLTASLFLHMAFPRYYWLLMGLAGAAATIFSPEEAERNLSQTSRVGVCRSIS